MLGLLGPNGAGKTTTLRMVMGLITPDRRRDPGLRAQGRTGLGDPVPHRQFRRGLRVPAAPVRQGQPGAVLEGHRPSGEGRAPGRGAGDRRARHGHQPAGPHLLAGHAAAAGDRAGDARPARPAVDGRTDQRARPAADPRHAGGAAPLRRHRPHRAGLQPPAVRGRADLQPRGGRAPGQDDRLRDGRRTGRRVRGDGLRRRRHARPRSRCCGTWPATSRSPRPACRPTSATGRPPRWSPPWSVPAWRSTPRRRGTGWRTCSWR